MIVSALGHILFFTEQNIQRIYIYQRMALYAYNRVYAIFGKNYWIHMISLYILSLTLPRIVGRTRPGEFCPGWLGMVCSGQEVLALARTWLFIFLRAQSRNISVLLVMLYIVYALRTPYNIKECIQH